MSDTRQSAQAIPVTILSGFLGAGKTTLLNHLLRADHGLKVAVLVNDFGAINIDAQLISSVEGDDMINLANGCVCCTIRGDLLRAAIKLVERPDPPEYIVVEPSGVSDPVSVAQTFQLPEVRDHLRLDAIIAVVDAEQIMTLEGANAYMAYEQLAVADIIIINKVDLVTPEQLAALKRKWLYPTARIYETTYGNVPPELLLGVGRFDLERLLRREPHEVHTHEAGEAHDHEHGHAHDHSTVFASWSWRSEEPLSLKGVQKAVKKLPTGIFRAKGILYLADDPQHRGILQMAGTRVTLIAGDAWGDSQPYSQIVAIGTPDSFDPSEISGYFEAAVTARRETITGGILGSVLTWFRGDKG